MEVVDAELIATTADALVRAARDLQKAEDTTGLRQRELSATLNDALGTFRSLTGDAGGADLTEVALSLPAHATGDQLGAFLQRSIEKISGAVNANWDTYAESLKEGDGVAEGTAEPVATTTGFRDAYMELVTREFGSELNQLRETDDFEQRGKVALLVDALESGAVLFSEAEQNVLLASMRAP